MERDKRRIERLTRLMTENGLDALICQLPHNVLMASGYFPVLGQSIILLLPDGDGTIIAPESELSFAQDGWFRDIRTFNSSTLEYVLPPIDVIEPLLVEACCEKGVAGGVLGVEMRADTVPASYVESYSLECTIPSKWTRLFPSADFKDASDMLQDAAAIKTPREIERITIAGMLGQYGFEAAKEAIHIGTREVEVAVAAKSAIERETGRANVRRVGAWAYCMSGPRSADAWMPCQLSTNRRLESGDAVLVHVNCSADGYWADLTRTFFVGQPTDDQRDAYDSVLVAWSRAVDAVGEGVKAVDVDSAARIILSENGFGDLFRHGTGHGVGFKPIYHGEMPVIHPQSDDVLENDMVFNIEPAVYLPGKWGIRVCDVISIRGDEGKVLSDMRRDIEWAICPI